MRVYNKGNVCKHIRTDKKQVHIYPKTEEDIDEHYKIKDRIANDLDLEIITKSKKEVKPKITRYTNEQLYKMKKDDQIKLINRYGINIIPKYEKGRVELILELQA